VCAGDYGRSRIMPGKPETASSKMVRPAKPHNQSASIPIPPRRKSLARV
jgi:hypothetical protein